MKRVLSVFWADAHVGQLWIDEHGDMRFRYTNDWVGDERRPAISMSLPKREKAYDRRATRPFFAGLLPEENQRAAAARAIGVSSGNDFALLEELGGDVAGALTMLPDGETPPVYSSDWAARSLDEHELARLLDILPQRPLLIGEDGIRMSLAGAQPKLPVVMAGDRIALPAPGQPTTHILKPEMERFPDTAVNEAFAMRAAGMAGLGAASVELRRVGGRTVLLVERYDRRLVDGHVERLHQEDFCQALGIAPERKYAAEGGPNFAQCAMLVRQATISPAIDVLRLFDAAVFNLVIGNADAHGKNFSLLYHPDGTRLAPLYDLMATALYAEVSTRMAMPIGRASNFDAFDTKTWIRFAETMGMSAAFVRRRVIDVSRQVDGVLLRAASDLRDEGFGCETLDRLVELVALRVQRVIETAQA